MDPNELGKAYDQITHLWQSKKFNKNNGIEQHKKALAFITNRTKALDVGCGCTGRFIELLLNEGFSPEGVDVSTQMVRLAQERHPDITFHQQDICEWVSNEKYDFITAWDSIWHIPLNQQEKVISKLVSWLNPKGILIFSFGGTDKAGEHIDDFMGPKVNYSTLGVSGFLSLLINIGCACRHLEYEQHSELHAYVIVQKI